MKNILLVLFSIASLSVNSQPFYTDNTKIGYSGSHRNLDAQLINNRVTLTWNGLAGQYLSHYVIYRSTSGSQFSSIGTVLSNDNAMEPKQRFEDLRPARGRNLYQVEFVYKDGRKMASEIIDATFEAKNASVNVFMNPGSGVLNLALADINEGEYIFKLYNNAGQLVHQNKFYHYGVRNTETINLSKALNKGIYRVQLVGKSEVFTQSFML